MSAPEEDPELRKRRQRSRNLAMLFLLLGLVALFFVLTLVQLGGANR